MFWREKIVTPHRERKKHGNLSFAHARNTRGAVGLPWWSGTRGVIGFSLTRSTTLTAAVNNVAGIQQCTSVTRSITCYFLELQWSDTYWQKLGAKYGVCVRAFSFKTHNRKACGRVVLTDEQLQHADDFLHMANKTWLNCRIPRHSNYIPRSRLRGTQK